MRPLAAALVAGLALLAPAGARAGDDVDLIPQGVLEPPTKAATATDGARAAPASPGPKTLRTKLFAEDAFSAWSQPRGVPVAYPSPLPEWQNRTSVDAVLQWKPRPSLTVALSDRLNVFEQDGQDFASADTVRNDLREVSLTWEPTPGSYLEAGRINVRSGAALGYNPTDFFKTRTLVGQASLDPSVIRQNRLGTLMLRAQTLWSSGSASVAYAPKVAGPSPIAETNPVGIDPRFDATNAAHRVLCTLNFEVLDLSPQLLAYFELHRSKVGVNVTRSIGDAVVVYGEWAAGPEQGLIARAQAFGRETGTLPPGAPLLPSTDSRTALRNDAAAGFSWTIGTAVTLNVEYHFHEAGFARGDWRSWFDLGSAHGVLTPITGALWFVRGYANDQQEPVSQHQIFFRASWPRALVPDLELSTFAFVSLLDGSVLSQLSAGYYVSDAWTASAYVSANFGGARTERGSAPQAGNAIVQVTRYF
ncbi:MAG TPA: hypothetical protein VGI39_21205 [Polyangiaceae bacterium]|jgi:hypothetical protein